MRMKNLELGNKYFASFAKRVRVSAACLLVMIFSVWAADYPLPKGDTRDIHFYNPPVRNLVLFQPSGQTIEKIILCIGDGMGFNQIAMARQKAVGMDGRLWMETLPVVGFVRTFSASSDITDSAAASTAMACGVKTHNGVLGIGTDGKAYASVLEMLSKKGWRTGLVVTSTITHATPAGFAAHVSSRHDEEQIARQMFNHCVDILFGGGRKFWLPVGIQNGARGDRKNLIVMAQRAGYHVVQNREEMMDLTYGPALGLFANETMTTFEPEPMLSEMAQKAIELLSAKSKDWFAPEPKFFLMIEGSQIDSAGHAKDTDNSIRQTLLFDMAVKEALDFARQDHRTLLIITADHETGGLVLEKSLTDSKKIYPDWKTKEHTGADVPLFAFGPGAQDFAGVQDNTDIAKKIAKLTNLSPFPVAVDVPAKNHKKKADAITAP